MESKDKLEDIFTKEHIQYFKNNKQEITSELLETLRSYGNEGKQIALEILDIEKDSENYYLDAFGNRMSFDGNRGLKKAYTKISLFPIHIYEIEKCAEDIHYFKDNYIKIKTPLGINFPDIREYQNDFINVILPDEHENIAGKMGRQSGKSVSTGIYLSWMYTFNKELNIGIVGNKGAQAREFLNTTKNMLLEIPIWMQQGTTVWNKGSIENESKMRILTDVPSSDAFRGFTISILVCDEAAFIRSSRWDEFIDSIMPSQSGLAWKKNIIISTMKGMNHWYEITKSAGTNKIIETTGDKLVELKNKKYCLLKHYNEDYNNIIYEDVSKYDQKTLNESLKEQIFKNIEFLEDNIYKITLTIGINGFVLYELDWRDVPRFNSKGLLMSPEEFQEQTIAKNGILYFNQNYANEAIGSSHTLISSEKLKQMESEIPEEKRDGKLNIYHYPEKGHRYIMSVDPSMGVQGDFFAVQIVDITDIKFKQVATARLNEEYLKLPEFLDEWGKYYNNALIIIENNTGSGQSIADILYQTYEYENLYFDKESKDKKRKKYPGFRTTAKSRKVILDNLRMFIENDKFEIKDKDTITEFFQFVLVNDKYQADEGCHDDMIMSLALIFAIFVDTKNFEDITQLISNMFSEENDESDSQFSDYLTIGNFDDGYDEEEAPKSYTWNGYSVEVEDGFY